MHLTKEQLLDALVVSLSATDLLLEVLSARPDISPELRERFIAMRVAMERVREAYTPTHERPH